MSNARKLFRMLKSLAEVQKIEALLQKVGTMDLWRFILKLIPRVAFCLYWVFDTLLIMGKIKVLPNLDMAWVSYKWATCWTIANLSSIANAAVNLMDLGHKEASLLARKKVEASGSDKQNDDSVKQELIETRAAQFNESLMLIKSCGDSITSTNLLGWPKQALGYDFNDGIVGCGGLTSALISCYQVWPAAKK